MGATASRTLLARYDGETTGLARATDRAEGHLRRFDSAADKASHRAGEGFKRFGRATVGVGVALSALTLGLAGAGMALLQIGDDAAAMRTGVAKAQVLFGESFAKIEAAALKARTLTVREFEIMAAGIQDFLIPMGFTRDRASEITLAFMRQAEVLALWSAGTLSATDVAMIFQSAMAGEYDSLQRLGIGINAERVALEAAKIQKHSHVKLTEQQANALAILKIATSDSTDAQNFWNSAAGRQALKAEETKTKLRNLWQEIQEKLLPIYDKAWQVVENKVIPALDHFIEWLDSPEGQRAIEQWVEKVESLVEAIGDVIGKVQTVLGWLSQLDDKIDTVVEKIKNPVKLPSWLGKPDWLPFSADTGVEFTGPGAGGRTGGPSTPEVYVDSRVYLDGQLIAAVAAATVNDATARQAWRARTGRR